jgi:hypothetical protein
MTGVREQKSQYARVISPKGDQSAICSLLLHRNGSEQSPMGLSPTQGRSDRVWVSNAAPLLYTLPENKMPQ